MSTLDLHPRHLTPAHYASGRRIVIEPVGGLGDQVMLASVLSEAAAAHGCRFHAMRRTAYTAMLAAHPAVEAIVSPQAGDIVVGTHYWNHPDYHRPGMKAIDMMRAIFALPARGHDEPLRLPAVDAGNPATATLLSMLPAGGPMALASCASDSPRKMMAHARWQQLADALRSRGITVVQTGQSGEPRLRGALSLLGATSPWQLPEVIRRADVVVTPDSFAMHAAHAVGTPAVALFGPTPAEMYAYPSTVVVKADVSTCPHRDRCIGPGLFPNYNTPCPQAVHCMNSIDINHLANIITKIINNRS